jgi:carbon storage regulator
VLISPRIEASRRTFFVFWCVVDRTLPNGAAPWCWYAWPHRGIFERVVEMLVLSRGLHDEIKIGDDIVVTVLRVSNGSVKIGVTAPRSVRVSRSEFTFNDPAESEGVVAADVGLSDIMSCVGLSSPGLSGASGCSGEATLLDVMLPEAAAAEATRRSTCLKS